MIYLLDTNVVSDFLKQYPPVTTQIVRKLADKDQLLISRPVYYELMRMLFRFNATTQLKRLNDVILPQLEWVALTDEDWLQAARFWATTVSAGKQLADTDLLLAAITQRLAATLITSDDDFDALPIKRANWRTA